MEELMPRQKLISYLGNIASDVQDRFEYKPAEADMVERLEGVLAVVGVTLNYVPEYRDRRIREELRAAYNQFKESSMREGVESFWQGERDPLSELLAEDDMTYVLFRAQQQNAIEKVAEAFEQTSAEDIETAARDAFSGVMSREEFCLLAGPVSPQERLSQYETLYGGQEWDDDDKPQILKRLAERVVHDYYQDKLGDRYVEVFFGSPAQMVES